MNIDSTKISKPTSIQELVQNMEKHPSSYRHLQIFLRRESNTGTPNSGEQYLAVSPNGFGLYQLESVDYQNRNIIISLTDTSTKEVVTHSVDINNSQPTCLYVRWKDIKNMVFDECMKRNVNDNDLLELIG
jgi:hypothetical protein